jgi:hypothetical protein
MRSSTCSIRTINYRHKRFYSPETDTVNIKGKKRNIQQPRFHPFASLNNPFTALGGFCFILAPNHNHHVLYIVHITYRTHKALYRNINIYVKKIWKCIVSQHLKLRLSNIVAAVVIVVVGCRCYPTVRPTCLCIYYE